MELYGTLSYFSFCGYWIYFNFCLCLCICYSYRNCEFHNRIEICVKKLQEVKKDKSAIKKKKNKYNKIILLAKTKLNSRKILISRVLIDLFISPDELVSLNNVVRECVYMKEGTKNLKASTVNRRF